MRSVPRYVSSVVGGFLIAFVFATVLGLVAAGLRSSETPADQEAISALRGSAFIGSWIVFGWIVSRSRNTRRTWGRTFMWMGIFTLAAPIGTTIFSAGFAARQTGSSATAGAALGGVAAAAVTGFVAFFLAAFLFAVALALLRGGDPARGRAAPVEATRTCPRCAETIKMAAAVCRYCGTDLNQRSVS